MIDLLRSSAQEQTKNATKFPKEPTLIRVSYLLVLVTSVCVQTAVRGEGDDSNQTAAEELREPAIFAGAPAGLDSRT